MRDRSEVRAALVDIGRAGLPPEFLPMWESGIVVTDFDAVEQAPEGFRAQEAWRHKTILIDKPG